jgi:hypothetical protein
MAKKKTGLYIGLGVLTLGVIYLMTKKTTPTTTATALPASASSGSGIVSQASGLISTISKLFGGGSSSPAPGTAAAFAPVSMAPTGSSVDNTTLQSVSPAGQINYINPTAPGIPISAPMAPATAALPDSTFDDPFNSEA